ncbi:MAG: hypothetical protein DME96_13695 [Verrucomicrobia bacterium]|nr:MAG: hypothetical protein DME96_13695 [Verrucomicrobiota bacterium]
MIDLPYIPAVEILRIKDATLDNGGRLKKVKSFTRLAIKSFAITGNLYATKPITQSLLKL